MKKIIALFLTLSIALLLCSCSLNKNESNALDVIKTYVNALEENDTEKQQECMDPSVNAFSEGLVNSLGGMFGISDAYNMANGAMGLLGSASEQALGVEIKYNFKDVLSNNISGNSGDITVKYELSVTNKETKKEAKQDVSWKFYMVQKDSKWYIQRFDEPQSIVSAEKQEELENVNTVGGKAKEFTYGKAFSCGVAWVQLNNGNEKSMACINTEGTIQFILIGEIPIEDEFHNGVALVSDLSYKKYRLIDTLGNTVYDFYKENTSVNLDFTDIGYTIVEETEETYKGEIKKEGLLNNNGEWLLPLQENCYINYRNDGLFLVSEKGYEGKIYDSKINEFLDEETMSLLNKSAGIGGLYSTISENLIYIETGALEKDRGFYNLNGELVIDLNEYDYIKGKPYFIDGYACFSTNNFTIIMDKNGEIVCDPIKGNLTDYCYENMENAQIISVLNEGRVLYYDYNGNLVLESDWNELGAISDGLISAGGQRYVNIDGNVVIE